MEGWFDPYTLLAAFSGVGGLWVLLLLAYRRIPKQPAPDDVSALRYDFAALVEQFEQFVQSHDQTMASNYAKVGRLRGKLRRLQEEEGLDTDEVEDEAQPPAQAPLAFVSRDEQKRQLRAALAQKRGVA